MSIQVLFFAGLRQRLGCDRIEVAAQAGMTIASLRAELVARGGDWEALAAGKNIRAALNQDMCAESDEVKDGDEVAFFPPVTGG